MAEAIQFKYRAFLSYSHRDKAWGKWLHAALEGYRIDKDLVGRETPAGPVPKTLRPIFRDREDFSAGHSLTEQTLAALEASQFLIVLCSPNAAQSKYVNEEVRRFKAMGRAERVIPVIVDGEPGDPARECFPRAHRPEAMASYLAAQIIARRNLEQDSSSEIWLRDLSGLEDRIGALCLASQGQFDNALEKFSAILDALQALADRDPKSTRWQHDLSLTYQRIGANLIDQGKFDQALVSLPCWPCLNGATCCHRWD